MRPTPTNFNLTDLHVLIEWSILRNLRFLGKKRQIVPFFSRFFPTTTSGSLKIISKISIFAYLMVFFRRTVADLKPFPKNGAIPLTP
jgi:hypothetical protein